MTNNSTNNKVRATLIELFSRIIPINKQTKVYSNDADNLYPNRIERIINNSPTAFRCANLMSKYITGIGLQNDVEANKKKNYKLSKIVEISSNSIAYHYGCYFHVTHSIDFKINKIDILEYTKCRTLKEDSDKNKGKIIYKDYEDTTNNSIKEQWFYPYNPDKEVILSQMKADSPKAESIEDLIKGYRGQVFYLNLTPQYQYALSLVDSVYNDADSEYRFSLHTNNQMRNGFLGKTVAISQGIDEETDNKINKQLKSFMGAENIASVWHLSISADANVDLDKALVFKKIESDFDDKTGESSSKRLRQNILGAFNNVPEELILSSNGLFGGTSDKYSELKEFYSEQTKSERKAIEDTLQMFGFDCKIIPISGVKKSSEQENIQIKLKAQAELKASVGGVTSLVLLVQNVSAGTLDLESAVQILIEIYGFKEVTARKMIGTPKII